jgi:hypothetical protein
MLPDIDTMTELGGAKILEYLTLTLEQKRAGNTSHVIGGKEQVEFSGLAICQYEDDEGIYLFYCDSEWNVLTDTWHETVKDAEDQASFEFEGLEYKWKKKL